MRSSSAAAEPRRVLLLACVIAAAASAMQVLEPPTIEGPTYAAGVVQMLQDEIAHFGRIERSADDMQKIILRASINIRILAAELISQGDATGAAGSTSVLLGLRLVDGREALDEVLIELYKQANRRLREGGADDAIEFRALEAAARFNDAAVDRAQTVRTIDPTALDANLPLILAPLGECIALSQGVPPVSHWPARSAVEGIAAGDDDDAGERATVIEELKQRISDAPIDDALRAMLTEMLDDERDRDRVAGALGFLDAVAAASWPNDDLRDAFLEELRPALALGDRAETAERLAMLSDAIERMNANREIESRQPPRQFRAVFERLRKACAEAEDALVAARNAPDRDAPVLALLLDRAQRLDDLHRVARMEAWVEAIAAIEPRAADPLTARLRRMSQWLLDAGRRAEVVAALDEFERQLGMFHPLPFEEELAANDREAIIATGGLHADLLNLIDATRREWATQWARTGTGGEAGERLLMLHRLTKTMADGVEVIALHGDTDLLNRWAAWEMPRSLAARTVADVPNRLKLATAAATRNDWAALSAQLDRMDREAPLARLVGRLSLIMGDALERLPDGAPRVLGQIMYPPKPDAWLLPRRQEIAELCRYAIEADAAWFEQREEDARKLQGFVNARADELLDQLDGPLR